MKLSQYIRDKSCDKFPIDMVVKLNTINNTHNEYIEIAIMNKTQAENEVLYEIRYITNSVSFKAGDIIWVNESWCAKYEIVKIFIG